MISPKPYEPFASGLFTALPMDTYRAAPGVSKSDLDLFAVSPRDYTRRYELTRESTDAMELGTALHAAVLEREARYYVKPETYGTEGKPWNGNAKECKAWLAAHNDKPVLSAAQARALSSESAYVCSHPLAGSLLCDGLPEVSAFATDDATGVLIKGRIDYLKTGADYWTVVDLKRVAEAATDELQRAIQWRRYYVQAAMYRRLLLANGAPYVRFYFIALQPSPLRCNVQELNPRAMDLGDEWIDQELAFFSQCLQANRFPEWRDDPATGAIPVIDLPERCYPEPTLTGLTKAG